MANNTHTPGICKIIRVAHLSLPRELPHPTHARTHTQNGTVWRCDLDLAVSARHPVNVLSPAGGTPSRPRPLPVADKANLQRQHLSPPQFPNLHAVTHPPNSCQKPSMRVPERPSSTWSLSFLSPSESSFICWQHATEHVHSEGAFSFLHTNKSLSDNHHTSIHLQLTN